MIRHYLSRDETLSRLCRLTDSLKMSMPLLMATLINRLMRVFINDVSTGRTAAVGFARTVGMLSDVGVFLGVVVGAFIFLV